MKYVGKRVAFEVVELGMPVSSYPEWFMNAVPERKIQITRMSTRTSEAGVLEHLVDEVLVVRHGKPVTVLPSSQYVCRVGGEIYVVDKAMINLIAEPLEVFEANKTKKK